MTYTAVYWRYGQRYEKGFEEEHDAVNYLMAGEDEGSLSTEAVLRDGRVMYDKIAFHDLEERLDYMPMPPTIDGLAHQAAKRLKP